MKTKKSKVLLLTESALMIALATILSMVKLLELPYGGSITACSMLPIILISYRNGIFSGALTAAAYSLIQLLLGADNLSYATSGLAVVLIILLDYFLPFTLLCFAGLFKKSKISQSTAIAISVFVSCVFRYACHIISGYVVWRDISIPSDEAWLFSFGYNAVYMIPEFIITLLAGIYLSRVIDFRNAHLAKAGAETTEKSKSNSVFGILCGLSIAVTAIIEVLLIAGKLQNESGVFSIEGIVNVDVCTCLTVLGIGVAVALVLFVLGKLTGKKANS